jgi:hypothetical protein
LPLVSLEKAGSPASSTFRRNELSLKTHTKEPGGHPVPSVWKWSLLFPMVTFLWSVVASLAAGVILLAATAVISRRAPWILIGIILRGYPPRNKRPTSGLRSRSVPLPAIATLPETST